MKPADLRKHAKQTSVIVNDAILAYMKKIKRENVIDPDVVLAPLFRWQRRCQELARIQ